MCIQTYRCIQIYAHHLAVADAHHKQPTNA